MRKKQITRRTRVTSRSSSRIPAPPKKNHSSTITRGNQQSQSSLRCHLVHISATTVDPAINEPAAAAAAKIQIASSQHHHPPTRSHLEQIEWLLGDKGSFICCARCRQRSRSSSSWWPRSAAQSLLPLPLPLPLRRLHLRRPTMDGGNSAAPLLVAPLLAAPLLAAPLRAAPNLLAPNRRPRRPRGRRRSPRSAPASSGPPSATAAAPGARRC